MQTTQATCAECEVLKWVRMGKTNREIAVIMSRSEFTIKTHVQRLLKKAGANNRTQLTYLNVESTHSAEA